MDRNTFYRLLLLSYYVFYGFMLVLGLFLPSNSIMTWEGPRGKLNTILGFVVVNLVISFIIIMGEYRFKKSIERNERILTVFFGSHTLTFKVLREDYIPAIYLFVLSVSMVTFFIYLHFYLATLFDWDITYMRTPGSPIKPDAVIPFGPLFVIVVLTIYKFYKWNQRAIKFEKNL